MRRLLAYVFGLPKQDSALARKRLGDRADWDNRTELSALSVEYLQMIFKALGGEVDFQPIPRPYETAAPEPEPTVGAGEIMDFLKGI